ncbi:MAG: hypothetical protein LBS64_02610 [Spirochaetaceae bacterium]|jgi:hypothetical protein|nr:hypothetical protein [Spirochaetaceae bacterium]
MEKRKNSMRMLSTLLNSQKKTGFDLRRYFFTGTHKTSGNNASFFIEIYVCCGLSRSVTVRFGLQGAKGKAIEFAFPLSDLTLDGTRLEIRNGQILADETVLRGNLAGDGVFWDLSFATPTDWMDAKLGGLSWHTGETSPEFQGTVHIGDHSFSVNKDSPCACVDHLWGSDLPAEWFFLYGTGLTSVISRENLPNSFFLIRGLFPQGISLVAQVGEERRIFHPGRFSLGCKQHHNCVKTGDEIHWSVSIWGRDAIIDIDVICAIEGIKMGIFRSPAENKQIDKLTGTVNTKRGDRAEIRMLKPMEKTLEIIEHALAEYTVCEYGLIEHSS